MSSDAVTLVEMLQRADIAYEARRSEGMTTHNMQNEDRASGVVEVVRIGSDDPFTSPTRGVDGYYGFYTEFGFDEAGNLKMVGVWE